VAEREGVLLDVAEIAEERFDGIVGANVMNQVDEKLAAEGMRG
jgi:hypothetical protein